MAPGRVFRLPSLHSRAFSQASQILIVPRSHRFHSTDPAEAILDAIGREMLLYRSYGRAQGGKHITAAGEEAEQNFSADHHNLKPFAATGKLGRREAPRRAVFGLPHPYFFSGVRLQTGEQITVQVTGEQHDRRASPLFIHIHSLGRRRHAAVFTFLPARFLEEEHIALKRQARIEKKTTTLKKETVTAPEGQWQPILDFLQREAWKEGVSVW